MALKGKRKSRSRGKRPAGAPRTIQRATQLHRPWYATTGARIGGVALLALVAIVVIAIANRSGDEGAALEKRRDAIERFTGDTLALLQKLSPAASEMVSSDPDSKKLADDAARWDEALTKVQTEMTQTVASAPPEVDVANRLIFQAVLQYIAAAKTYQLVPDTEGKLRDRIYERAGAQVAAADGTWQGAISVLDQERRDAGLDPSQIRVPSAVTVAPTPTGG